MATKQKQDGLKLSEDQAEAIIEKGIEYGAYSDDMPESKKDKLAAADEIVTFSIDAYVNDGITSDDEDEAVAESGRQIEEILEMAGVEIEDGEPVFGEAPDVEGDDDNGGDEDEDESEGEDDEGPFNPDDYIEGYSELSVVTKLKKVRELDPEDDEDAGLMEDIADWENEQEKPSSRVLAYIEETLGEPEADEEDAEDESDEDEEDTDEPEDEEGEDDEEPWDGYDKASAVQIKKVLQDAMDEEELSREQVEYVLEYEQAREKPPARKRVIDFCNALLAQFDNGDDAEDEEPEEKPKRGRGRGKKAESKASKSKAKAEDNGLLSIAINGEDVGEFDAASVLAVIGSITEQIEGGATSLALDLS